MENISKYGEYKEYKVKGYSNRWYVVDRYRDYVLLENCTWGDETFWLVAPTKNNVQDVEYNTKSGGKITLPTIQNVLCETYDLLDWALRDEGVLDF